MKTQKKLLRFNKSAKNNQKILKNELENVLKMQNREPCIKSHFVLKNLFAVNYKKKNPKSYALP